jgi:hypothetical protein
LQIPPQPHRHRYVQATVRVHEYPDGRVLLNIVVDLTIAWLDPRIRYR